MKHILSRPLLILAAFFAVIQGSSCSPAPELEEVVARISISSTDDLITKTNVVIDDEITTDGNGSARIATDGPVVVSIAEIENLSVDNARLIYRAKLRTDALVGQAYLEMWCVFAGRGEFFSRALHAPLSGTNDWIVQETPFLLEAGQVPSSVKLNLVIDGTGKVWLDDVTLSTSAL